ncbi:hypothetical protein WA026_018456 [Henosepilachna vigintioctopunctata]|uniref:Ig-like domain-containing protein n=1 Tax=Henosepilachna vigintioctopunctata TaxID=420089 RepID=A0AAW1V1Z1_9CUCU
MGQKVSKCCKCCSAKHSNGKNCADPGSKATKDAAPLVPATRRRLRITGNLVQLTLDNVQKEDAGIYKVTAKSPQGTSSRDLELRVSETNKQLAEDEEPPAFLRRLNDLSVKVGTRTRFLVEIRSSSELIVEWFHNEERVEDEERLRIVKEGSFFCLDVAPVIAKDAGRWMCTARNASGQASSTSHLNVLVPKTYKPPEFHEELRALLTEQGTVSLESKVVGVPTPLLRWFKDGQEIRAGDVFALTANKDDPTSLGTYMCEAVNCMGRAVSSSKLHVIGKGSGADRPAESSVPSGPPPMFIRDLKDDSIKIGEPLTLSCQVMVPPWPKSITWYNSEGKIDDSVVPGGRYHQMADGLGGYTIEVKPTEAADQGEWKCVATSADGSMSISRCEVKMTIPKYYKKPRFMDSLKAILTEEGLVSFECKVVGSPTPLLRWFKDGQELKPGDVYLLTGTNSLGSYCCIARNCMGEARSSAELTIEDIQSHLNDEERTQLISRSQAPKILHGLKSNEVKINEPYRFSVQVSVTTPLTEVSWFRDDNPVENEPDRYIPVRENLGVHHLDVTRVECLDQAEWKFVATNDFGHSVTTCFLKVLIPKHFKKPKFLENLRAVLSEEGAVNLECKVIGVPQPVLKWYKDGVELKPGDIHRITSGEGGTCCLGTYTCEARNCMGTVASSASLLGFEDQTTRAQQQRIELARIPSLSTIHEERTSQLYDTAHGDQSLTIDDRGEVSFSFDGKDVSVSLYETPDLTEDEAIQIVEMYADQMSEHISEHNIVELPSLRFVKESSTSGNLVMEAVVVDVSEDYFTAAADEDLRTEADLDDLYSITDESGNLISPVKSEQLKIDFSSIEETPKRPPRKSDSQKTSSFHSLSKNLSIQSDGAEESLAGAVDLDSESIGDYDTAVSSERINEKRAFQIAAITETTSLPESLESRRPLTPHTTHEIGSDLRMNRSESEDLKSPGRRMSSQSFECTQLGQRSLDSSDDSFPRDIQGEEGDGLVIDRELKAAKQLELKEEETNLIEELKYTLMDIANCLKIVEQDIFVQSSQKLSSTASTQSIELLNGILQPVVDIHKVFEGIKPENLCTVEFLAPPIFELQKGLSIMEKCIEVQGKDHTLIQKTCVNILDNVGPQIHNSLALAENITLLQKELDSTKASGRTTPSKLIQEVCITIKEMVSSLDRAESILQGKKELWFHQNVKSEPLSEQSSKDSDILERLYIEAVKIRNGLEELEKIIAYEDPEQLYSNMRQPILDKLNEPLNNLKNELDIVAKQSIKYRNDKTLIQELRLIVLDQLSSPLNDLRRSLQAIVDMSSSENYSGAVNMSLLESFVGPTFEIIHCLEKLKNSVDSSEITSRSDIPESSTSEVVKDVFNEVSKIVYANISQLVDEFLLNIEMAQKSTEDTALLEALRQLATLQKDFASIALNAVEIESESSIKALESLSQPLQILNSQIVDMNSSNSKNILDDIIASLSILEESILVEEDNEEVLILFSHLKGRTWEVKENICGLTERGSMIESIAEDSSSVVVVLEECTETVVAEGMIEDTRVVIEILEKRSSNSEILESIIPSAEALDEIIHDDKLLKSKSDLSLQERFALQKYVQPLEYIEDQIIECMDNIIAQPTSPENNELKVLLEHLQYNVAVIHQQIIDETHFLEETPKPSFDHLKKCIAVLQNLPIITETPEIETVVSAETSKAILESVYELEKCIAGFCGEKAAEKVTTLSPNIAEQAAVIADRVQELKQRSRFEEGISVISTEDIAKIKELSEPLRRLSECIALAHRFAENGKAEAFNFLLEPLEDIDKLIKNISNEKIKIFLVELEEPLVHAIEIISLEKENSDITNDDVDCLSTFGQYLNNIRDEVISIITNEETGSTENLHEFLIDLQKLLVENETDDKLKFIIESLENVVSRIQLVLKEVVASPLTTDVEVSGDEYNADLPIEDPSRNLLMGNLEKCIDNINSKNTTSPRKQTLLVNLQNALSTRTILEDLKNIPSIECISLLERINSSLITFGEYFDHEIPSTERMKSEIEDVVNNLNSTSSQNEAILKLSGVFTEFQTSLDDILLQEKRFKEVKMECIEKLSETIGILGKQVSSIKFPDEQKTKLIDFHKTICRLQPLIFDLFGNVMDEASLNYIEYIQGAFLEFNEFLENTVSTKMESKSFHERKNELKVLRLESTSLENLKDVVKTISEVSTYIPVILNGLDELFRHQRNCEAIKAIETNLMETLKIVEEMKTPEEQESSQLSEKFEEVNSLIFSEDVFKLEVRTLWQKYYDIIKGYLPNNVSEVSFQGIASEDQFQCLYSQLDNIDLSENIKQLMKCIAKQLREKTSIPVDKTEELSSIATKEDLKLQMMMQLERVKIS